MNNLPPRSSGLSAVVHLTFALSMGAASALASTGTATSSPTPSAYIESPQPTVTVSTYSSSPTYYSGMSYSGGYSDGYWRGMGGSYSISSHTYQPRRYFFPPTPPPLGEAYLKNRTKSASLARSSIPLALSEYLNEPFYAPLSPFLYEESLSKRRQKTLDDYRTEKAAVTAELRAKIAEVKSLDPATRASRLAEFAQQQSSRIAALESTAYEIRTDLTSFHWFADSANWNEGREWRLGDDTRWESTLDDAKVMRGAAYYQEGLTPAQRRLLREYAMELDDSGRGPAADMGLDSRGPYFYFSPETSRIRLPSNLPADLQAKITSYTQQKSALKKELRDTLYREDRRWFASTRENALRELARRQAPALAALEPLAEEIRRGLEPLPNPARPAAMSTVLPAEMTTRINAFVEHRSAYQTALTQRVTELRRQFPTSRIEFVKMDEGYGIQLIPYRRLAPEVMSQAQAAQAQLESFNAQQIRHFVELTREKNAIRETLVQSAGAMGPLMSSRIVDLILREYGATLATQELWRQYEDYEVAVLWPGLSAEQRRLLYDAALVKLDLQLPAYTY